MRCVVFGESELEAFLLFGSASCRVSESIFTSLLVVNLGVGFAPPVHL